MLELEQILIDDAAKLVVGQVLTAGVDGIRKIGSSIGRKFRHPSDITSVVADLETWAETEPDWQIKLQALFAGSDHGVFSTVDAPPDPYVNRDALIELVRQRPRFVHVFHGLAGCGMTAFTRKLAESLADLYPAHRCYVDLRHKPFRVKGILRYREVMIDVLGQLGIEPVDIADGEVQLKRQYLANLLARGVLLILDDVASAVELTELAPNSPSCLVIATTRKLTADLEVGYQPVQLLGLGDDDALALLADSPASRTMIDRERDAAVALLNWFGNMPLSIKEIAGLLTDRGARSDRPIEELLAEFKAAGVADVPELTAVGLAATVKKLSPGAKQAFPLLAALPAADFTIDVAAALFDVDVPRTDRIIKELIRAALLTSLGPVYRLPQYISNYARQRTGGHTGAAAENLDRHYLIRAIAADLRGGDRLRRVEMPAGDYVWPDRRAATEWLDNNREALGALAERFAHDGEYERVCQLATALENLILSRKRYDLGITMFEFGATAAKALNRSTLRARMVALTGRCYALIHAFDSAAPLLAEARETAHVEHDVKLAASTEEFIGAYHQTRGDWLNDRMLGQAEYSQAVDCFRRAVELDLGSDPNIERNRAYGIHARMLANALIMIPGGNEEALRLLEGLERCFDDDDLRNRSRIATVRAKAYSPIDQNLARTERELAWRLAEQSGSLRSYRDELRDIEAEIEFRAREYDKARSIWGELVKETAVTHNQKSQMYLAKLNWPEI